MSYDAYKTVWKKNQKNLRGITWKLRNREQPVLCATRPPDLMHIPIRLHEDILTGYRVMVERTKMLMGNSGKK